MKSRRLLICKGVTEMRQKLATSRRDNRARLLLLLLAMEVVLLIMTALKGYGRAYLPVGILVTVFALGLFALTVYSGGDSVLILIAVFLTSLGFVLQVLENKLPKLDSRILISFAIVAVAYLGTLYLYPLIADFLKGDICVLAVMTLQIVLGAILLVVGRGSGADITIFGVTPFELVKVAYTLAAAALLQPGKLRIIRWRFDRQHVLVVYTMLLCAIFLACSELGTMLVVLLTGLSMLFLFGTDRKLPLVLSLLLIGGFLSLWLASEQLYPRILSGNLTLHGNLPGRVAQKLIERFGSTLHPEKYYNGIGKQGTRFLRALIAGGLLGIPDERYRISMPNSVEDSVFADAVQTYGVLMGCVILLCFYFIFIRGVDIASRAKNNYYRCMAMSVTLVLVLESLITIAYSMAVFPITGIPTYYMSRGFTALLTGMVMTAVLIVISSKLSIKKTDESPGYYAHANKLGKGDGAQ